MIRTFFQFTFLLSAVVCFHVKIANTAGKNTFAVMSCVSHDPDWNKVGPGDVGDGSDWQYDFGRFQILSKRFFFQILSLQIGLDLCSLTRVHCGVSLRTGNDFNNLRSAGFDVFNRCDNAEHGYFLRGDGVYQGTMDGKGIKKIADYCTNGVVPGKGCSG